MVLPVVERELRVAARRRSTYRTRVFAVIAMLVGFGFAEIEFAHRNQSAAQQGQLLFSIFTWLAFAFAALAGLVGTADCVSSEKREGTLGLLFLTDLKGYDVICGKLAANSVSVLYALVASVPVISLPILMGGVGVFQFIKVALMLGTILALSCALGIFVSTYSRNERKAMVFATITMLIILFGPIFLGGMMASGGAISDALGFRIANTSPVFCLAVVLYSSRMGGLPPGIGGNFYQYHFWLTFGWLWLLTVLFLTRSAAKAPLSWQEGERAPGLLTRPIRIKFRGWKPPRAILDINPYQWLALRGETTPKAVWGFTISMFVIWGLAVLKYNSYMWDPDVLVPMLVIINSFLKIWIVGEASRRFLEDRQNNALEFLLSTPLSQRDVLRGQTRALWRLFGWPLIVVALSEWFITHRMVARFDGTHFVGTRTPLFLVADAFALAALGMWFALKFKGRIRVMITALAIVTIIPRLVDFMSAQIAALWTTGYPSFYRTPGDEIENTRVKFVTLATILFDFILVAWAATNLKRNFRRLATERFTKP